MSIYGNKINYLVENGFLADRNVDLDACPNCRKRHIRPWQQMQNALLNSRPITPMDSERAARVAIEMALPSEIETIVLRLLKPDGLAKFESLAQILAMHEDGKLTFPQYIAIAMEVTI
jgi:hypothetical protein